jgi:RND superfamily putative drug exporter
VAIAANRWFPAFLDRLVPNFSIEGEEWFREHDRRAAEEAAAVRPAAPV